MNDCIFCSIVRDGTKLIWQNDWVAALNDIDPDAPVHVLIVPKMHIPRLSDLSDPLLAGELMLAVREVAELAGTSDQFQVAINNGQQAGQLVDHLHIHVLANPGVYMAPARRHLVDGA
jgi:histidine triad (HIT) family protein